MELLRVSSMNNTSLFSKLQQEIKNIFSRSDYFDSVVVIKSFIDWFVENQPKAEDDISVNCKWMDMFKTFWGRLSDILDNECITDNDTAHQLRILSFVFVCSKHSKVLYTTYMLKGLNTTMLSFACFINNKETDPNTQAIFIEKLLGHFFSPQWLTNCGLHWGTYHFL